MINMFRLSEDQLDRLVLRLGLILKSILRPGREDERQDWRESVTTVGAATTVARADPRRAVLVFSNIGAAEAFLKIGSSLGPGEGIRLRPTDVPFVLSVGATCSLATAEWLASTAGGALAPTTIYTLECWEVGRSVLRPRASALAGKPAIQLPRQPVFQPPVRLEQ